MKPLVYIQVGLEFTGVLIIYVLLYIVLWISYGQGFLYLHSQPFI
jgi:hypothetical protein